MKRSFSPCVLFSFRLALSLPPVSLLLLLFYCLLILLSFILFAVPGCNLQEADSEIWGKYSRATLGVHSSAGDEGSRVMQGERLGCAVLTTKLIPL